MVSLRTKSCSLAGLFLSFMAAQISAAPESTMPEQMLPEIAQRSAGEFNNNVQFIASLNRPEPVVRELTQKHKELPYIAKQQGVWRGIFRRYDKDGKLTSEFPSEIIMRVIDEKDKVSYHQTNRYFPLGAPEEIIESYGEVRDGKIYFGNKRLDAWKMDISDDHTKRSAIILMEFKDGSGLYAHEIVSVSEDGRHRSRAAQYLKNGLIVRRTLIDEEKITDNWKEYDALNLSTSSKSLK